MHTGACGNAGTKLIDCICQSLIKANATTNQTVLQDTTGEYMDQESTIVMNLCPPAHMQAFHFVISLMGFLFSLHGPYHWYWSLLSWYSAQWNCLPMFMIDMISELFFIALTNCDRTLGITPQFFCFKRVTWTLQRLFPFI